jgi:hypothetical protein
VTDLLVYTNDCDDGTDALLAVLANHGILHHIIQGVSAGSPSRVNVGTPHWLTDRQMQDLLGQGGAWRWRPCCAQNAPMYDDGI